MPSPLLLCTAVSLMTTTGNLSRVEPVAADAPTREWRPSGTDASVTGSSAVLSSVSASITGLGLVLAYATAREMNLSLSPWAAPAWLAMGLVLLNSGPGLGHLLAGNVPRFVTNTLIRSVVMGAMFALVRAGAPAPPVVGPGGTVWLMVAVTDVTEGIFVPEVRAYREGRGPRPRHGLIGDLWSR